MSVGVACTLVGSLPEREVTVHQHVPTTTKCRRASPPKIYIRQLDPS